MNLENIKTGQEFKNYKELCSALCCHETTGTAKIKQLKELGQYFNFTKNGHTFIITEIYANLQPIENTSNKTKYKYTLDMIILDYLSRNKTCVLTRKECYKIFGFCNPEYFNVPMITNWQKTHEHIHTSTISEIIRINNSKFSEVLKRSLNRLERNKLVFNQRIINIVDLDNKVREATESEIKMIFAIQREVLLGFGFDSIDMIYLCGLEQNYYDQCNMLIEERMQFKQTYECLKLLYNQNDVDRALASDTYKQLREEFNMYLVEALVTKHKTEEKRHYAIINRQKTQLAIGVGHSSEEQYKSVCYPDNYIDIADSFNNTFVKLK